ncbi:hypothetical protein D6T64_07955 [Cryobacterium melibiosiphilum]|uniref:Uncharacterized protein n=1 Tax=Cryobacterium melibiosiphilum TaxID=995039 RepID=A0A3A5MVG0_9MICO|nr:hypothetical protein [Cryobacterium melibiosiphilum]RJT89184.1 hypothetical protein D6T64_07955 [Cryobacterium melibiosiphilum]
MDSSESSLTDTSSVGSEAAATGSAFSPPRWGNWLPMVFAPVGLLLLAVVFVSSPLFFGALVLGMVMVGGACTYGIVAVILITRRWIAIPRREISLSDVETAALPDIAAFRTVPQRLTLTLNVALLANAVMAAVFTWGLDASALVYNFGAFTEVAAIALIVANARWAYPRRFILGEHRALAGRSGAWRIIRLNRVLSYVVWLSYIGIAIGLVAVPALT